MSVCPALLTCSDDIMMASDDADATDAFGLLQRTLPRRVGKDTGPIARVLVSTIVPLWLQHPSHVALQRDGESTSIRVLPGFTQVCAPSNSALDEIVYRLISGGLYDKNGNVFTPNIVRVGVDIHHSVQTVALDNLVRHRLERGIDSKVRVCNCWLEKMSRSLSRNSLVVRLCRQPRCRA